MSMDQNAAWVLGGEYIRLFPLFPCFLNKSSLGLTSSVYVIGAMLVTSFPKGAIRTQQKKTR